MDSFENVTRMYCVGLINCFAVSGAADMKNGHEAACGLGFYLNVSRFNHSCRPDLFVHFDGARVILEYLSDRTDEKRVAEERSFLTDSPRKFSRLTVNYGYSDKFATDSFFPLRNQRRASLADGYYFHCQCVLCGDEREADLEERAAALECGQCAEPCLWKKGAHPRLTCCLSSAASKYACRKSCKCAWNAAEIADVKAYARVVNLDSELEDLEDEFIKAMAHHPMGVEDVIAVCEPVLIKARYLWHRSGNLRLAQLNERLFVTYESVIMDDWKAKKTVDHHMLTMALETGEGLVKYCDSRPINPSYNAIVAAYAYSLGRLYSISAALNSPTEHSKVARYWYNHAASIWEMRGGECADIVAQLRGCSSEESKKLTARHGWLK